MSDAGNLVAGDSNGVSDVFFHDRSTGVTIRVSVDSFDSEGDDYSFGGSISADGRIVAFSSFATNLVPGDTNANWDVFTHEFCAIPAAWSNYGAGYPGSNGVPAFTSLQNPVLGTTITLDLANSHAQPTVGLVFIGYQPANLPTNWGGDLLVAPSIVLPVTFSYCADSFTGSIPFDVDLCGVTLDLQALEADSGAAKGVSFTKGLELTLGY
jgi:hypothetical protein